MVELSNERIEQILNDETGKTEDVKTILRGIYTRYVNLYERYFADFDKLNEEKIEAFKKYHEETRSLIKYYYMDIPQMSAWLSVNSRKRAVTCCSDGHGKQSFLMPMMNSGKKATSGAEVRSTIRQNSKSWR